MLTSGALRSHFKFFVKQQIASDHFNSVIEVVRAGVRLLEGQEQLKSLKRQKLRASIKAGTAISTR